MTQYRCHVCGAPTLNGDIYCGVKCQEKRQAQWKQAADDLRTQGFEQHPDAPNVFVKDGVHVTVEEAHHYGIDKTIAAHGIVAAGLAAGTTARTD